MLALILIHSRARHSLDALFAFERARQEVPLLAMAGSNRSFGATIVAVPSLSLHCTLRVAFICMGRTACFAFCCLPPIAAFRFSCYPALVFLFRPNRLKGLNYWQVERRPLVVLDFLRSGGGVG